MTNMFGNDTLTLRPLAESDCQVMQGYLNHPAITGCRYLPWKFPETTPLTVDHIKNALHEWSKREKGFALGIELCETGDLVGHCECDWDWDPHCPSLSIVVIPSLQRRGIGSQVLSLLLTYLFRNTPAHNVNNWIVEWNKPGRAFAATHGFTENGAVPRIGIREGQYVAGIMVDILRPEWLARGECDAT